MMSNHLQQDLCNHNRKAYSTPTEAGFETVIGKNGATVGPNGKRLRALAKTATEMLGNDWYRNWLDTHFLYDPLRDVEEYAREIADALELEIAR